MNDKLLIFVETFSMCNYITWFYEEKIGYVIECRACEKLQVGFGNVLLSFLRDDFETFRKSISTMHSRGCNVADSNTKHMYVPTACAGLTLLLNTKELYDLHNMVEHADTEMKAQQLMGLFNINE